MSESDSLRHVGGRADVACALLVALLTGALYVATLQPDLGGPEDTPKFQFLGYVLGTAHPPGYPLYVLLSHVFVRVVRVGTIAYRANLFSAVMAAISCVAVFAVGRLIGSSRWPSVCAAIGLAAGSSFWRSAVFAEVYSLAAAAAGVSLALLLMWGARGHPAWLLGAIGTTAAGFGNHLTIVGVIPAYVGYVLWRNPRVLTLKFLVAAASLVGIGVAQYGFIIIRTRQHALYLESRASNWSELKDVVLARRFADQRFAYSLKTLLTVQVPVVTDTIAKDLSGPGLALVGAGCVAAMAARSSAAVVVMGAGAGLLVMIVNLGGDVKGFITPLMVFVWPLAALGANALGRLVTFLSRRRVAGLAAASAAAALMPVVNISANYKDADQSRQTDTAEFFRALHQQLPDGAGVVAEDYFYDMSLHYYRLTGEAPAGKRLVPVTFDADMVRATARGTIPGQPDSHPRPVFAFAGAVTYFLAEGLRFVPVPIEGLSLTEWLARLPSASVLAGATAYLPGPLDLAAVGHPNARPPGRVQNFETFGVVVRKPGERWTKHHAASSVVLDAPTLGARLPNFEGTLRAVGDEKGARIEVGDRTVVSVTSGIALAVFRPDGTLMRTLEFPEHGPRRVRYPAVVYRFSGEAPCVRIEANKWSDVSLVFASGSAVSTLFRTGTATLDTVVSDASPVLTTTSGILGDAIGRDVGPVRDADGPEFWRSEFTRTGGRRSVFRISLNRTGVPVHARFTSNQENSTVLCGLAPTPLFRDGGAVDVIRADFAHESYFGAGWSGVEGAGPAHVRLGDGRAALLLPLEDGYSYRLTMDLSGEPDSRTEIFLNGALSGACDASERKTCTAELRPNRAGPVSAVTLVTHTAGGTLGGPRRLVFRAGRLERWRVP